MCAKQSSFKEDNARGKIFQQFDCIIHDYFASFEMHTKSGMYTKTSKQVIHGTYQFDMSTCT